jgi:molybdenum cofactor biosynthesis protein B
LIKQAVQKGLQNPKVDAVIVNGGTGISKRDITIEVVQPLLEKELVGFGEIFRLFHFRMLVKRVQRKHSQNLWNDYKWII